MKERLLKCTAAAISLVAGLLLAELGVRYSGLAKPHFRIPDYHTGGRLMPNARYVQSSEGESQGRINSKGLRDYEYDYAKAEDVYRILVFGDSFTEGMQVDLDDTFVKVLERNLNEASPRSRYEVINMGVSGYGTASEYLLYTHEGIRYDPDLVILAFFTGNDFRNNSSRLETSPYLPAFYLDEQGKLRQDTTYQANLASRMSGWRNRLRLLKNKSCLVSLLVEKKESFLRRRNRETEGPQENSDHDWFVYLNDLPDKWEESYEITKQLILKFKQAVEKNGSEFLLLTLSNGTQLNDSLLPDLDTVLGQDKYDLEKPDRELAKFAAASGIRLVQLLPTFRVRYERTGVHFHGFENGGGKGADGHWNEDGHRLAGDVLSRALGDVLLAKTSDGAEPVNSDHSGYPHSTGKAAETRGRMKSTVVPPRQPHSAERPRQLH